MLKALTFDMDMTLIDFFRMKTKARQRQYEQGISDSKVVVPESLQKTRARIFKPARYHPKHG